MKHGLFISIAVGVLSLGVTGDIRVAECLPPPAGLVSWWPGDDNAGDIAGSNPGTLINEATFAAGWVDQAFLLDGVEDYVEIPDSGDLDGSGFPGLTIEAWINPVSVQGPRVILSKYNSSLSGVPYYLSLRDGALQQFVGQDSPNFPWTRSNSAVVSVGVFTHVAGSWDGSSIKIYVDGKEVPGTLTIQGSFPTTMLDNAVRANIGSFEANAQGDRFGYFEGLIDEVKIYNRALSATEIRDVFLQNKC